MSSKQAVEFMFDYKKQINTLRISLIGSIALLILCFFTIMTLAQRKPFVIRVSSNGETAVIDEQSAYSAADGQEAKYFSQEFLNLYLAPDSDSISKDLSLALSWMIPDLQTEHTKSYSENEYIELVKGQKIHSELYLNSVAVSEQGGGYFAISKGIVETYKKDTQTTVKRAFEARLNLIHTQRTAYNPQGLLVNKIDIVYRDEPLYKEASHDQEVSNVETGE